jgi:hypothetical protein
MLVFNSEERIVHLRTILITALATATVAFAQNPITADSPYQIRYASNLNVGDSVINISNTGASLTTASIQSGTTAGIPGSICVNVYAFRPDEQILSCCSCPVTPNGLVSLSARSDLISNGLTPGVPTSIVIKLVATAPIVSGSSVTCNNSAATVGFGATLANGMVAWGTTVHQNTSVTPATYSVTETAFTPATLSTGEAGRLGTLCGFAIAQGSGFGICNSCRVGGLGGQASQL